MISTCDRHVDLLGHIERSSDEFAMSKNDKGIASGRNWFPNILSYTWTSFSSFLLMKVIGLLIRFLRKLASTTNNKKDKLN